MERGRLLSAAFSPPPRGWGQLSCELRFLPPSLRAEGIVTSVNNKHLKNVGPIRHNEPPHAHSADVASGTVARRLRIDVHDDNA